MNKASLASLQLGQLFRLTTGQQIYVVVAQHSEWVEAKPLYGTDHVVVPEIATRLFQKRGSVPESIAAPQEVWVLDPFEQKKALTGRVDPPCRGWRRTVKCRVDDNH